MICESNYFGYTNYYKCEFIKTKLGIQTHYWVNSTDIVDIQNLRFNGYMIRNYYYKDNKASNFSEIRSNCCIELFYTKPFIAFNKNTNLKQLQEKIESVLIFR